MTWVDLIDGATELTPRKWKRCASVAFVAALFLFPNAASRAIIWYATERAQHIVSTVLDSVEPAPTSIPTSSVP